MKSLSFRLTIAILTSSLLMPTARTQAVGANSSVAAEPAVLISPGDLLDVSIYDSPDLAQQVRVEADGRVTLNLLGSVKLAGMTAQQAGDWMASEYRKRNYFNSAEVTVLIKENARQAVSITGEVAHPGVYPLLTTRSILDVVSLAGGLTDMADTRVTIKHRSGAEQRVTVKLKTDEAAAALDVDAIVYPGDLVIVPRAGIVYVMGEVGAPRAVVMHDNGKITVLEALAQAGAPAYTAAGTAFLLHKADSGYVTTQLHVNDMLRGRIPDLEMANNDILYVPPSKFKHMAQNTQSIVQSAVGASVYHAIP
jgi:polysaccharide export outer membrane protein